MKRIFYILLAVALLAFGISTTTDVHPVFPFLGILALSAMSSGAKSSAIAGSGLNKEVWLRGIKEPFEGDGSWIGELEDWSEFVENDVINFAEAGGSPSILIDNTTYPIATQPRPDGSLVFELHNFETTNTSVKHADRAELSYNKIKSVTKGHKAALADGFVTKGAHAISPASDTFYSPIIESEGTDDGDGFKSFTFKTIRKMRTRLNNAKAPKKGRILVLSATHEGELEDEDLKLYDKMLDKGSIYGFKVYVEADEDLPHYNTVDGSKLAYGAVPTSTHQVASFVFAKTESMKAKGTEDMFHQEPTPQMREDVIGFSMRGLISSQRGKAIGAMYKAAL